MSSTSNAGQERKAVPPLLGFPTTVLIKLCSLRSPRSLSAPCDLRFPKREGDHVLRTPVVKVLLGKVYHSGKATISPSAGVVLVLGVSNGNDSSRN